MGRKKQFTSEQERIICEGYLSGDTTTKLGKIWKCASSTISTILKRHGVTRRQLKADINNNSIYHPRNLDNCQISKMIYAYVKDHKTIREIAKDHDIKKDHDINYATIWYCLNNAGLKMRKSCRRNIFSVEEEKQLCEDYKELKSSIKVGLIYGISHVSVLNIVRRHGKEVYPLGRHS